MEIIQKKISLKSAMSGFDGKLPSYLHNELLDPNQFISQLTDSDAYNDWGKFPVNIIIDEQSRLMDIKAQLPLVEDLEGNIVLRYRTMVDIFSFLMKFKREAVFYKKCKRNDNEVWRKITLDFFDEWDGVLLNNTLPDISDFQIGDIICIHEQYEKFIRLFRLDDSNYRYENDFYEFVKNLKENGTENYSEPFINVPLYLEEEIMDNGVLTPYIQVWEAGKKYYLGEYVLYSADGSIDNLISYQLKLGDNYELCEATGEIYSMLNRLYEAHIEDKYEFIRSESEIRKNLTDKKQILVDEERFYFVNVFYKGYYNPATTIVYFDEKDNMHWVPSVTQDDSATVTTITGKAESQLHLFKSKRKSYDINGNVLPFILDEKNQSASLSYKEGVIRLSGGTYAYLDEPIIDTGNTTITFSYVIGCDIEEEVESGETVSIEPISGTGVVYTETHPYQEKTYEINGSDIAYIDIDFNDNNIADIEYYTKQTSNDIYLNMFVFKDESTSKLTNVTKSIDANIERGKYSAFERHNALGEVKTFSDLQNYKNNMFKL